MLKLTIDNRSIIPVRMIPFVTGWKLSPDVVVQMLANSDSWHRVFIPSFHILPDGSYYEMLPKEWDVFITDLELLSEKLHSGDVVKGESYPIWRKQAIEKIPASTFVWLDELEEAYTRTESRIIRPDERLGDRDINLQALIPQDMRDTVYEGFNEETEYKRAWNDFAEVLPKLKDELSELMNIQPESMEAHQQKKSEIKKLQKKIAQILTPGIENQTETPAARKLRLEEWLAEEKIAGGERGALKRTAEREGISRQALSEILQRQSK